MAETLPEFPVLSDLVARMTDELDASPGDRITWVAVEARRSASSGNRWTDARIDEAILAIRGAGGAEIVLSLHESHSGAAGARYARLHSATWVPLRKVATLHTRVLPGRADGTRYEAVTAALRSTRVGS